jgi:hypothetical protein
VTVVGVIFTLIALDVFVTFDALEMGNAKIKPNINTVINL